MMLLQLVRAQCRHVARRAALPSGKRVHARCVSARCRTSGEGETERDKRFLPHLSWGRGLREGSLERLQKKEQRAEDKVRHFSGEAP